MSKSNLLGHFEKEICISRKQRKKSYVFVCFFLFCAIRVHKWIQIYIYILYELIVSTFIVNSWGFDLVWKFLNVQVHFIKFIWISIWKYLLVVLIINFEDHSYVTHIFVHYFLAFSPFFHDALNFLHLDIFRIVWIPVFIITNTIGIVLSTAYIKMK